MSDDKLMRKARAERLRKKIKDLISGEEESPEVLDEKEEAEQESPREFIERRMKELEEKKLEQHKASGRKKSPAPKRKNNS